MAYGDFYPNTNLKNASAERLAEVIDPVIGKLFAHAQEPPAGYDPTEFFFNTKTTYDFPFNGGACTVAHTTPLKVWGASEWDFRLLDEGEAHASIAYPGTDEPATSWQLRTALDTNMIRDAVEAADQLNELRVTAEHNITLYCHTDLSEHHDRTVSVRHSQVRQPADDADDCWDLGAQSFLFKDRTSLECPDQPVLKAWRPSGSDLWQFVYRTHPYEGHVTRLTNHRLDEITIALDAVGMTLASYRDPARAKQQP